LDAIVAYDRVRSKRKSDEADPEFHAVAESLRKMRRFAGGCNRTGVLQH
jgi:hypothetical protein